jgi:twitching motility two-component system response regulator PilG
VYSSFEQKNGQGKKNMLTSDSSRPTVMAVDDSAVMQNLVKRALEPNYRVLVADNAVDALSLIYHHQIAVLLLDVSMPGIDGLELCRTVRNLPQFQNLPVIMLTARDGLFDKVQGRLAGATEYLTKPFDAEQLRMVVGKFAGVQVSTEQKQNA